jgi:hypothetical protein
MSVWNRIRNFPSPFPSPHRGEEGGEGDKVNDWKKILRFIYVTYLTQMNRYFNIQFENWSGIC